jgi:hypothetical protein
MKMTKLAKTLRLPVALGVLTLISGSAFATELCHNIGGPRDLGANCDGTGTCTYELEGGGTIEVAAGHFLGILLGEPLSLPSPTNASARAAHIAHGDGFVELKFDPPLHLASEIGPHRASNVECLAERLDTMQPPEPGN